MKYKLSKNSQIAIEKAVSFFEPYESAEKLRSKLSSIRYCPYVAYDNWLFDFDQNTRFGSVSLINWDVGFTEYGLGYTIKNLPADNDDSSVTEDFLQITIKWNNYAFSLAMLLIYDWSVVQISVDEFRTKYEKLIG